MSSTPFDSIEWSDLMDPPSSDRIAATENTVGATFPKDFVQFCADYHGGFPDPDEIEINGFGRTMINQILPFDDAPEEQIRSIATVFEAVKDLPPDLVPFAEEPGGNYFCFDYRTGKQKVVFWFHEQGTVFNVCDSFTELIELLANS